MLTLSREGSWSVISAAARPDLQSLRSALASEDFERIRKKGHNLFGSGGAYGLDRISELGADLERAAKKHNTENIGQLIDMLEALIRKVRVV